MLFFLRPFIFILTILFFTTAITASADCPRNVPADIWEQLVPHFLPLDHPAKAQLDKIFLSPNILQNSTTLKVAGFKPCGAKGYSTTKILKHKKLKNYLVKAFTDDQPDVVDWFVWLKRIKGALAVKSAIDRHDLHSMFKVPQKWIYQVPRAEEHCGEKNFILVVEEMKIYDQRGNHILWKGDVFVTKEKLQCLYVILQEEGLFDSVYVNNIPFGLDGKITFVDTEHFHKWPVNFNRLSRFLSKKMQIYWSDLISNDL